MHALLHRYTQALLTQVEQGLVCNRFHATKARCCRWLLLTHDRAGSDQVPLTQEFVASMLGVQRTRVMELLSQLHEAGLIQYTRGQLTIRDRAGLEASACACYQVITAAYARLLG